ILEGLLDDVPEEVGEHLLCALREALANAARHSGATKVDVRVRAAAELWLTVCDNGSGIKVSGRRSGLNNLDQRALSLGGSFQVAPAAGGGTELDWRVPLASPRLTAPAGDRPQLRPGRRTKADQEAER